MPSYEVQSFAALAEAAAGRPIDVSEFAPDLEGAPSPNRWLGANAARALAAVLAVVQTAKSSALAAARQFLGRIADQVAAWPLWANENRSPDYWNMHLKPIVAAWVGCLELGLDEWAEGLRKVARAMIAHLALGAVSGQARHFTDDELKSPMRAGLLRSTGKRSGPRFAVAMAGARGWTKAVVKNPDGTLGGRDYWSHVNGDDRGTAIEYFSGLPVTHGTTATADLTFYSTFLSAAVGKSPLWSRAPRFATDDDTRLALLTTDERRNLSLFLSNPLDRKALGVLVGWVNAVNPPDSANEWLRGEKGCATIAATSLPSSTDPAQFCAAYQDGTMEVASSFDGQRKGPAEGRAKFEGMTAVLWLAGGEKQLRVDASRIGAVAYRLRNEAGGPLRVFEASGSPVAPAPPTPEPPSAPRPAPAPDEPSGRDKKRRGGILGWLLRLLGIG